MVQNSSQADETLRGDYGRDVQQQGEITDAICAKADNIEKR
jgi:hypothetical protein